MNISDLLQGEGLKFLKWVEIITDENQAVKTSAMYILQKDLNFCDVIFVSDKGKKRKLSGISNKIENTPLDETNSVFNQNYNNVNIGESIIDIYKQKKFTKLPDGKWMVENISMLPNN